MAWMYKTVMCTSWMALFSEISTQNEFRSAWSVASSARPRLFDASWECGILHGIKFIWGYSFGFGLPASCNHSAPSHCPSAVFRRFPPCFHSASTFSNISANDNKDLQKKKKKRMAFSLILWFASILFLNKSLCKHLQIVSREMNEVELLTLVSREHGSDVCVMQIQISQSGRLIRCCKTKWQEPPCYGLWPVSCERN